MGRTSVSLQQIIVAAIGLLLTQPDGSTAFAPFADRQSLSVVTPRITSSLTRIIRPRHRHAPPRYSLNEASASVSSRILSEFASEVQRGIATIGIFAAVLVSPISISIHINNDMGHASTPTLAIERSRALALTENQQMVADVWSAVTAQFFDQSFNGLGEDGWRAREKEAILAVADTGPDDDEAVTAAIGKMLSALDDPYTRFLPRDKYEALTAYATGTSSAAGGGAGIGVQLLEDPRTKNVVVMATTRGGPAAVAGVKAGDVLSKVDGESMYSANAEVVAAKCRGEPGTRVDVEILRAGEGGETEDAAERITLTRSKINPIPTEASAYVSAGGKKVGLLRVPSFSTSTVSEMVEGLRSAAGVAGGVDAIAIDLRGNVGGYMPAGVDAAKLFLPAGARITAEVGPSGRSARTYDADGVGAETGRPVYLLVDSRTASAAEIFAAALRDNRRATVVGTGNTFGKGRIQNVRPLGGGGVAVTRARYVTPGGRDIHGVSIAPDREPSRCEANDSARTCLADIVDDY